MILEFLLRYIKLATLWFHEKLFCERVRIWVECSPSLTLFLSMFSLFSALEITKILFLISSRIFWSSGLSWIGASFNRRFSILCSDLSFPFCICRLFGRFPSVLSFLFVTAPNHSRQTSYITLQKDDNWWSMGPLRWALSKKESSWSKFVQVAVWLPLGHWILGLWGMSPGRCRLTMGPWTLWGYSWFISPSIDLHSPAGELRCLHQRALWIRNPRKLLNSLPQSHVIYIYIYIYIYNIIYIYICVCVCVCVCVWYVIRIIVGHTHKYMTYN